MTVSIPDVMIDDKVEEMLRNYASQFGMIDREMSREELMKMMGLDEQVVNMSIRPGAEAQVKSELLFEAIAENEAFTFTEEETEAFINSMAENVGASADLVKQYFGMEYILAEQKKEKASELMFETAVPVLPKENTEPAVEETAE
jgi:FKBP-type peptidyl-prolyl cis-trans isomerase (trigger factor)